MTGHERLSILVQYKYPLHDILQNTSRYRDVFPLSRIKFASTMLEGLVMRGTPTYTLSLLMPHDSRMGLATHPMVSWPDQRSSAKL